MAIGIHDEANPRFRSMQGTLQRPQIIRRTRVVVLMPADRLRLVRKSA